MPKIIPNKLICGTDCSLSKRCLHPKIKMQLNVKAEDVEILFVGEAPGAEEDRMGIPFVGRAGKLLRETIEGMGLVNYGIANACKCRPPNNRTPTIQEIKICSTFLKEDISSLPNLKLIVPLGNIAITATMKRRGGISDLSGKIFEENGHKFLPIFHPAYILYNQNKLKTFIEHMQRIPLALKGSLIDPSDYGTYSVIATLGQWNALVEEIRKTKEIVYDVETTSLNPFDLLCSLDCSSYLRCIGFCISDRKATVLPLYKKISMDGDLHKFVPIWSKKDMEKIQRDLSEIFGSRRIAKIGHNLNFDNFWMEVKLGIKVEGTAWDTKYSQFLLNENESNELKDLAWKYSRIGGYENRLLDEEPNKADDDQLFLYNAVDCDLTRRIYTIHKAEFAKEANAELKFLMKHLLLPVTDVLVDIEKRGIRTDIDQLDKCEKNVDVFLDKTDKLIHLENSVKDFEQERGSEFNANSHVQLREVLFKYEGLSPVKYTPKKSPSTDREVLEILSGESNLCRLLVDHSIYATMKSKMIKELREYMTVDHRIHTQYMLTRTVTGRSASKSPNMQNVTKGKKDVVGIRKVFVADPDHFLVEFDLDQHELRCMAEEAGDDVLAEAILSSDVHAATASHIFGIPKDQVTEDQRRDAKCLNFGLIYGITDHGIMRQLKCDQLTARMYIDSFFKTYSKTKAWMDTTAGFVKKYGFVRSRTGRCRRFPIWDELDDKLIREALNHPIQALASDILLYGLVGVYKLLKPHRSYICLEIHDSIVCNIHKEELFLIEEIKNTMLTYFKRYIDFKLPLGIGVKIGPSWGEMLEWKNEDPNQ